MTTTSSVVAALIGGVLIGLASVALWALNGRIAGVSGVAGRLWRAAAGDRAWRVCFLGGLVLGNLLWVSFTGEVPARTGFPVWALILGGLLVGYGTSMAGGCTSGHGVCGLARLSPRSLAAVFTFLAVAAVTTFLARHLLQVS